MKRFGLLLLLVLTARLGWGGSTNDAPVKLSFDLLKSWVYNEEKDTPIPKSITQYDGQRVEMTGYMMPTTDIKEIKEFLFMPSLWGCCYGQPPAPNHVILARMVEGKTSKFYQDMLTIRGVLRCGVVKQDGYVLSLYRIEVDEIVTK